MNLRVIALTTLMMVGAGCSRDGSNSTDSQSSSTTTTTRGELPASSTSETATTAVGSSTTPPRSTATSTSTVATTTTTRPPNPPSTVSFAPPPDRPPPAELVLVEPAGATDLRATQTCDPASPSTPAIILDWRPGGPTAQLLAVATLPDGFDTGRYAVSDSLPAAQTEYRLSPVEPGGLYYWRVLTRAGERWLATETATFTGPTCILDSTSST